jgi:DNA-binding transcriptional LysR family regulator
MVLLPGALQRLRSRWPQVQVRTVDALFPSSLTLVRSGEVDLAVGPLPPPGPQGAGRDLLSHALFEAHTVLAARAGHPLAGATRLADLADADWVLAGPAQGPGDPRRMAFGLPSEGPAAPDEADGASPARPDGILQARTRGATGADRSGPRVVLECESFATLLSVLPSLEAVALVPRSFFERHGPNTGLVRLPVTDQLPSVMLHAVWRADGPLTPPATALLDGLIREAELHRLAAL